jgi:hypothetical protein
MERSIDHPGWDDSWPTPVHQDIDDLEELGMLRVEPSQNAKRIFSLTVTGRGQARVLEESAALSSGGRAPDLDSILGWLMAAVEEAPEILDLPTRILDRAASEELVGPTGREALAARIVDLYEQGFLAGDLPGFEQASAEDRLRLSDGLRLTMKAHDRATRRDASPGHSVTFNGTIIADQVAAGDITNYTSFGDLLDRAEAAIGKLESVDADERKEALGLVAVLRGKAFDLGGEVLTGAGGGLLAGVIAQLLGLPKTA